MNTQITADTALVLIDVQKGIDDVAHWGGNRNNPDAEKNIGRLLSAWRSMKRPVIIVQHNSVEPASPLRPSHYGNELKDFVRPAVGEKLITKSTTSAFIQTDLQEYLTIKKIRQLVIAGFVTNNSVEATARMAGDMQYKVFVVSDATATFDKRGFDRTKYDSHLIHEISLANLSGEYATIVTTDQLITP
jgi:nicotinamidase-related amidase